MSKFPQVMINVPLANRVNLATCQPVQLALRDAEAELAERGRVLLRPSGTEPLVRVMVEGADASQVQRLAQRLADTVRAAVA